MSQLYEFYKKDVVDKLLKGGTYTNRMQIPKVEKVVLNMGVNANHDKDVITEAQQELATIKRHDESPCWLTWGLGEHVQRDASDSRPGEKNSAAKQS